MPPRSPQNWYRFHALALAAAAMSFATAMPASAQVPAVTSTSNYEEYTNGVSGTGPCKIVIDANGNLFYADQLNGAIDEIPAGQTLPFALISGLQGARAVTFDSDGNLYVAGPYTPALYQIPNENGTLNVNDKKDLLSPINNTIVGGTSIDGYYMQPEDIVIQPPSTPGGTSTLYISELYCSNCLSSTIFQEQSDGTGAAVFINNLPGIEPALSMALDTSGNLYYGDNKNVWMTNIHTAVTPVQLGAGVPLGKGYANVEGITLDQFQNLWINNGHSTAPSLVVFPWDATLGAVNPTNQYIAASNTFGQYAPGFDKYGSVYTGEGYGSGAYIRNISLGYTPFGSSPLGQGIFGTAGYFAFNVATTVAAVDTFTEGSATSTEFSTPTPSGKGVCLPGKFKLFTSCSLGEDWTPAFPGPRSGAVILADTNGNALGSLYLSGYGVGAQTSLLPGTVQQVLSGTTAIGGSTLKNPQSIAVDGSGDVYIADTGNSRVVEVPNGSAPTVLATPGITLEQPVGVISDGGGNVFILDEQASDVVKVTPKGVASVFISSASANAAYRTFGGVALTTPLAMTMDQYGDLFILDSVPATSSASATYRVVELGPGGFPSVLIPVNSEFGSNPLSNPSAIITDGLHDFFIADTGNNRIVEFTAAGTTSVIDTDTITLNAPTGVALDAAGDLYITDTSGVSLVTPPPAATVSNPNPTGTAQPIPFGSSPATGASSITLDASGDIFVTAASQNSSTELQVTTASLVFPEQAPGSTSAPLGVTVFNNGNAPLNINTGSNPSVDTGDVNFAPGDGTCSAGASIASSSSCTLDAVFTPQTTGTLTGTLTLADNAPSGSQSVALSGNAQNAGLLVITGLPSLTPADGFVTFTVTAKDASGNPVNGYLGTVCFSSTDALAKFYGASGQQITQYTFTPADNSSHQFTNGLVFQTPGNQTITAADCTTGITGTSSVVYVEAPATAIAAQSGSGQSTPLGQPFANPLTAYVTNTTNSEVTGALVTFTAPATGASGTFAGGGTTAQSYTNSSGIATSPTFTANATLGSYSVVASVTNAITNTSQTASFTMNNTQGTTSSAIMASPPSPITYGQPATLTATISSSAALAADPGPTGTATFNDGGTAIGSVPLVQGTGTSTATLLIPSTADDAALTAGTHSFTVTYSGDSNFLTSTSPATASYVVSPSISILTGPPIPQGQTQLEGPQGQAFNLPITVTGQYSGAGVAFPTGTLSYTAVGFGSGTVTLVNGVGTIVLPATTLGGTYDFVVMYSGDNNYQPFLDTPVGTPPEAPFQVSVGIVGFLFQPPGNVAPLELTVAQSVTATAGLTLVQAVQYAGTITLACTDLPKDTSCSFLPATIVFLDPGAPSTSACYNPPVPGGGGIYEDPSKIITTLDVFTTAPPNSIAQNGQNSSRGRILSAGIFWLSGLLLAGYLGYRRNQIPAWGRSLLTALVLTFGLLGLSACSPLHQSAAASKSNFNIVATGKDCERGTTTSVTIPATLTITPD